MSKTDDGASGESGRDGGCPTHADHVWIVITYSARIIEPELPSDTVRVCRKCGAYEIA